MQATRPFYDEIFKLYIKDYHKKFTKFVAEFWNTRMKEFDGMIIMQFLDIIYHQEHLINHYGMKDPRYSNSYNELISTFCVRTFKNMMPLILGVLKKMQTEYYKEKETICMSYGPVDLFKFINEVFGCYNYCKQEDVCKAILGLCYK